ncbi:MAG: RNA polymerase sigma factor [Clostridiales bacterium]|nr:RNA polymerase sigma factor [Clostridiales bacterium]
MALSETQFNAIYDEHADSIYRVCFMYLGNTADAEDALQNTFFNFVRFYKENNIINMKAWLITCAKNNCISLQRRGYRKDLKLEDWYAYYDSRDETIELVCSLPRLERLSIYLHYYEGYASKEIGQMIGKSESTVRGYLLKGRAKLKKLLQEAM